MREAPLLKLFVTSAGGRITGERANRIFERDSMTIRDTILRYPVEGPAAWTARDMESGDWAIPLAPADIRELDAALAHARDAGRDGLNIRREDFPLPGLTRRIREWAREIEDGRGFLVLKGFPVEQHDEPTLYALYWGFGAHFGDAIIQNYEGRRINEVRSRGHSYDAVNVRAYATPSNLGFHNDPSDMTGLLCWRQAKFGGESHIASAMTLYNEILREHPEFLEPLCQGFQHDVRGEGPTGRFNELTDIAIPVFSYFEGKLSCCLNTKAIRTARQKAGGALTALESAAFEYIEKRASQDDLRFTFRLQPGDLLLMSNYSILHGRSEFHDWPELDRRRCLLRLWLNLHEGRNLAPNFTGRFNTGHRGGAVIHDHTDEDLLQAGTQGGGIRLV